MKRSFSSKYEVCSKIIKTEAVFIKREMNDEWNVNFLQNSSLDIQLVYSNVFSIYWSTSETPGMKLRCRISSDFLHVF